MCSASSPQQRPHSAGRGLLQPDYAFPGQAHGRAAGHPARQCQLPPAVVPCHSSPPPPWLGTSQATHSLQHMHVPTGCVCKMASTEFGRNYISVLQKVQETYWMCVGKWLFLSKRHNFSKLRFHLLTRFPNKQYCTERVFGEIGQSVSIYLF